VSSPLQLLDRSELIDTPNQIYNTKKNIPHQTRYLSYFSIGLEPRINLIEINDDIALSVAVPMTIGLGQAVPHNSEVLGATGFGSIQIPLMLKGYFGSISTYKSKENIGLSIGAGFEYNKVALFEFNKDQYDDNKGWIMPAFSGSFHFWRGNSPLEVNVKYGFGREQKYSKNKDGGNISGGSRTTKASSLRLSLVYLLNY
jgi:hypothetical protein